MKNRYLWTLLFWLLLGPLLKPADQPKLDPRYERWIKEEVNYILSEEEKKIFLALMTDLERDVFIKNFWEKRDPLPLTPVNEFKEEHYQRLGEARERYGIFSDRGRIYILLGPPNSVDSEPAGRYVFPCEVWHYFSLQIPGFPRSLRLIFYKQWGFGDFRIYSPLFDGLEYLVPHRHYDYRSDPLIRRRIQDTLGTEFLQATESVSPGLDKMGSEKILHSLRDTESFNELRASTKPVVETFVSYEKIAFDYAGHIVSDGRGNFFYDGALSINPELLTIQKIGENYYGREDLYVTIADQNQNIVSQFNEQLALELGPEEYETKKSYSLTYKFSELLIPGEYTLKILLRDYLTSRIGEKEITLSLPKEIAASPVLLASGIEKTTEDRAQVQGEKKPFVYSPYIVRPRISGVFRPGENICFYLQLYPPPGTEGEIFFRYSILDDQKVELRRDEERRPLSSGERVIHSDRMFAAQGLGEGRYQLEVKAYLSGSENPLVQKTTPFIISSRPSSPGEFSFENAFSPSQEALYTNLGLQSLLQQDLAQAKKFFDIALSFSPGFLPAKINLAKCYTLEGAFDSALALLLPLLQEDMENSEIYTTLGNIYYQQQELGRAIEFLEKAAQVNLESVEILNFLASVYLESGHREKAKETFERSLAIKEDQPLVKSILEELKK